MTIMLVMPRMLICDAVLGIYGFQLHWFDVGLRLCAFILMCLFDLAVENAVL